MLTRSFELRNVHSVKTKRDKHELGLRTCCACAAENGTYGQQRQLTELPCAAVKPIGFQSCPGKEKLQFKTTYWSQLKASATSQMKL